MEWLINGGAMKLPREENRCTSDNQNPHDEVSVEEEEESMASLCERQQRCVKASIVSSWQLVEAQDQLCGLELHGSESAEQARARALASSAHLSQIEEEWRRKESMLDSRWSPTPGPDQDQSGFDKSIINNPKPSGKDTECNKSLTFVQRHEDELKHFGMLRRWDDSQHFLARAPHLICEETANYLILWCSRLYAEKMEALMEQVAHQAVVMQFILEMARSVQQDPRCCFRQFFHKAKVGQEGYLDVFHTELEAFKHRVKEYSITPRVATPRSPREQQGVQSTCRPDPKEVLESLPPDLKACIQSQDMHILQSVLSTMNPQVAEYYIQRCVEAGLCSQFGRGSKDEDTETDDQRMMEMS